MLVIKIAKQLFHSTFHDLPEAPTRDIITPVKYCVDELSEIIAEYEIEKIKDDILPNIPDTLQDEFSYILGLYDGIKRNLQIKSKIMERLKLQMTSQNTIQINMEAIDGVALKQCDKLSAFVEASLSISHGIKSKELLNGKEKF